MEKQTIAILSVSAGAGHVRAAEALRVTALASFPQIEPVHIDLMSLVPASFKRLYADSYIKVVERMPALWGYLYDWADKEPGDSAISGVRRAIERLNTRKLKGELAKLKPDVVICTHFLPAELVARMKRKGEIDTRIWVQVTDFDVHAMWVHDHIEGYCVASEEVAARLADKGVARESIHVTGIPIAPMFTGPSIRTSELRHPTVRSTAVWLPPIPNPLALTLLILIPPEMQCVHPRSGVCGDRGDILATLKPCRRFRDHIALQSGMLITLMIVTRA